MTQELTAAGAGIDAPPVLSIVPDLPEPYVGKRRKEYVQEVVATPVSEQASAGVPAAPPQVIEGDLLSMFEERLRVAVDDMEWRLAQAYEQKLRTLNGGAPVDFITVEDINDGRHRPTGYTLTQNSPVGGGTWASLHLVFKGVDYTIANGSLTSAQKYAWFVKPGSGTTATLSVGAALPVLGPEDALVFVNNGGVITSVLESSLPAAVAPGAITSASLAADVNLQLTTLQANIDAVGDIADGLITTYFQDNPPWASGAAAPSGASNNEVGDIWYDSNDGGAFRWSGTAGTPTANTWVRIADTDSAALTALVNTKTRTYLSAVASPPVAPTGGFVEGDFWMVTDQNNKLRRWTAGAWTDVLLGDAAISGIGGAKVGTGINATNVTTGTLAGTLVGTGVNATNVTTGTLAAARVGAGVTGADLTSGTGTIGNTQLGAGAVSPAKINAAFHILY